MYEFESDASAEKLARNQVAFREVNERIAELNGSWRGTEKSVFICECSNQACADPIEIAPAEYERVRAHGARFVVAPGHQFAEVERVVEQSDGFLVVEKVGLAAGVAQDSDPRNG